jgi:hypothetical protein
MPFFVVARVGAAIGDLLPRQARARTTEEISREGEKLLRDRWSFGFKERAQSDEVIEVLMNTVLKNEMAVVGSRAEFQFDQPLFAQRTDVAAA